LFCIFFSVCFILFTRFFFFQSGFFLFLTGQEKKRLLTGQEKKRESEARSMDQLEELENLVFGVSERMSQTDPSGASPQEPTTVLETERNLSFSSPLEREIDELYAFLVGEGWMDPFVFPEDRTLFVGNVDTKESDAGLEMLFRRYGELTKMDIKQRGQSKFCFVSFADPYSSFNLLFDARETGIMFGSRNLVVRWYSKASS
jgi:hypothetical protein